MVNRPRYRTSPKSAFCALACAVGLALSEPAGALTIDGFVDNSIANAPNAAAIEDSILTVIDTYETHIADPIDVKIFFAQGHLPGNLVSGSDVSPYLTPYNGYVNLLALNAAKNHNTTLTTAVTNLSRGNVGRTVRVSSAALRALGISANLASGLLGEDGILGHGNFDGVVTLSSDAALSFERPVPKNEYDAQLAIAHEIDEVLGVGGAAGSILNAAFDTGQRSPPFFGGTMGLKICTATLARIPPA